MGEYTKKQIANTLKFSRFSFYCKSKLDIKDNEIAQRILDIYNNIDDTLGAKKLAPILGVGKKRCKRIMDKYNIKPRRCKSDSYTYPGKSDVVYPNLLINLPENIQITDIYYSDMFELKLVDSTTVHGCFVLKHLTRQVLSLLFDYEKDASLLVNTIDEIKDKDMLKGGICHFDQAKQHGAKVTVNKISDLKMHISMSRAGTPTDNPYAERFVGVFKLAVVYKRPYYTLGDFLNEALMWINFYNEIRPHESLNDKSPNDYATSIGLNPVSFSTLFRV